MNELEQHHWRFEGLLDAPLSLHHTLLRLVKETGLRPISKPKLAAFVVIAESHIALDIEERTAVANVFSCEPFDEQRMADTLRELLGGVWAGFQMRPELDETKMVQSPGGTLKESVCETV